MRHRPTLRLPVDRRRLPDGPVKAKVQRATGPSRAASKTGLKEIGIRPISPGESLSFDLVQVAWNLMLQNRSMAEAENNKTAGTLVEPMTKPIHRFRVDYILKVSREREDRFVRRAVPPPPKTMLKAPPLASGFKRTSFPG